jgi:hypothetical protein
MPPSTLGRLTRAAAVVALLAPAGMGAQCADGSQTVNGVCRAAATAAPRSVPIDRNRVAVLPFRVTTADSLLGEGFAELLAQEFTGQGGPRAVDMSTMLSAWRRAGGGLRTPLPLDSALSLARRIGAGILLQGTIVGAGAGRVNISASMLNASSAAPIGAPARVSGAADSVESLMRQTVVALLGTGVSERVMKSARLSTNPAALRLYIEGLALWRRGHVARAAESFEASVKEDSLFASAIYQRWLFEIAYGSPVVASAWAPKVRARAALLTSRERAVFEAQAGTGGPARPRMQVYLARRRAAEQLGDSPDAWFMIGDYVYHYGNPVVGFDSSQALARQFFSLAVALDTQPVFLYHLSEIAINSHDTTLMRRLLPAYQNVEGEERWIHYWAIATALKETRLLDSLRRVGPPKDWGRTTLNFIFSTMVSRMSVSQADELVRLLATAHPDPGLESLHATFNATRGRLPAPGSVPRYSANYDQVFVSGDASDSVFLEMVRDPTGKDNPLGVGPSCVRARLVIERGGTTPLDSVAVPNARCRATLLAMHDFNKGILTDSALARLDTLATVGNFATFLGFENRVLARIYEARGDTARALRAIQLYPRDYGSTFTAPTQRETGRLFLMTKDTARAIAAYEHYLRLRTEALPPLVAERDSIRALVTRLKPRVVP